MNGPDSSVVRGYGLGGGDPGFNPHHVKLSGLQVRPFKVSGGSPCPPPEQTPGNRASGRLLESTKEKRNTNNSLIIVIDSNSNSNSNSNTNGCVPI